MVNQTRISAGKSVGAPLPRRRTIGVMGSAGALPPELTESALERLIGDLAESIVSLGCVLVTGETTGIPGRVVAKVRDAGGLTVGIAPGHNEAEQRERYHTGDIVSDVVIYTGFGFKGRNVINIRASDIVVVFGGSIGTLNEFTIAYDEGKVIGVLLDTGGAADIIEDLVRKLPKKTNAQVIFHREPAALLRSCYEALVAAPFGQ